MKNTTQAAIEVRFSISHNISASKGWGRYKASAEGVTLVQSATNNAWVSATHSGQANEGAIIHVTLQTMERVGKRREERIDSYDYHLVADRGASATIGHWNGLEVIVEGARLA